MVRTQGLEKGDLVYDSASGSYAIIVTVNYFGDSRYYLCKYADPTRKGEWTSSARPLMRITMSSAGPVVF